MPGANDHGRAKNAHDGRPLSADSRFGFAFDA